jgi:hypothetical protein
MLHIPQAFLMQIAIVPLFGWWAGAFAGAFFFIGREYAQAEYRVIQKFYDGKRANMPWWGGFDPKAWNLKSMLDWLLPTVSGFMIAWFAS